MISQLPPPQYMFTATCSGHISLIRNDINMHKNIVIYEIIRDLSSD